MFLGGWGSVGNGLAMLLVLQASIAYDYHLPSGAKSKPIGLGFYRRRQDPNHMFIKHRKHNYFNYNYEDWEENDDVIDYEQIMTTEKVVETTENTTEIKTGTRSKTNATLVTTVKETNTELKTTDDNEKPSTFSAPETTIDGTTNEDTIKVTVVANYTGTTKTSGTTDTTSSTLEVTDEATMREPATTENLLEQYTSVASTDADVPTFILETYFPGTTFDVLNFTVPIPTTTKNPFIEELKEESQKHGYFTSSLIILLKTLLKKNHKEVASLLTALNYEVERLNREDKLLLFGGVVAEVFQSMVQMLVVEPADVMHGHLNYAVYALENRHTVLRPDTNTLTDVTDTVYIEEDLDNVAEVIKAITDYPDKKTAEAIIHTAVEAFVSVPFRRIIGTAKERLFIMELNSHLKKRLYPESVS